MLKLKKKKLCIDDPLLSCFSSYLSNGSFRVVIDGFFVQHSKVTISGEQDWNLRVPHLPFCFYYLLMMLVLYLNHVTV